VAVGPAGHGDLFEEGRQGALVITLDAAMANSIGIDDVEPRLLGRAQIEVILEQLADQRPALDLEGLLELTVGEAVGLVAVHEPQYRLELGVGGGERRCRSTREGDDHDRRLGGARVATRASSP
jgi:hypothetical protein